MKFWLYKLQRIPLTLLVRIAILVALLLGGAILASSTSIGEYLTEDQLTIWLTEFRQTWWSPVVLIGLYILTTFGFPAGPLLVAGSAFGVLYGSFYNVTGLFLASIVSFIMAKYLGREFVVHITGNRLRRAERYLHRYGFWPLVQTRFLPFPASFVNFGAALSGVPMRLFLTASFVGFIPSTVIHTYFIAELISAEAQDRIIIGAFYLGTFVVFNIFIGWSWTKEQLRRRKRYHQLCEQRSTRKFTDSESVETVRIQY